MMMYTTNSPRQWLDNLCEKMWEIACQKDATMPVPDEHKTLTDDMKDKVGTYPPLRVGG
jgi:hypothetical protein